MQENDFSARVDPLHAGLIRRLTLVLHDNEEAKDVAQEAYLRAWRAWPRFDGRDLRAWLHTIALRLAFNRLRRRRLTAAFLPRPVADPDWVVPERLDLWRALMKLSAKQRAALLLTAIDGYTQAEAAEILGAPAGSVGRWVSQARSQLRDQLADNRGLEPTAGEEVSR
jgi:RNA polymerase sigma-70 factor (ECF subfamily)